MLHAALDQYWISPTGATKWHISSVGPFELLFYGPLQAAEGCWSTNTLCVSVYLCEGATKVMVKLSALVQLQHPFYFSAYLLSFVQKAKDKSRKTSHQKLEPS